MAGDFNCETGPLDVEENYTTKKSIELLQLIQSQGLQDVFRDKNPLGQEYTFHRPGSSSSRLDRVYLTQDIVAIVSFLMLSDHVAVEVLVDLPVSLNKRLKKSKTAWKLNTSVLHFQGTHQLLTWELEQALGEKDWNLVAYLKTRLKLLISHQLQGLIVQSGSIQEDNEDEAMLFHARKTAARKKQSSLSKLRIEGLIETDPDKIKQEIEQNYNALYNGQHRTIQNKIVNTGVNFIPDWEYMEEFCRELPKISQTDADLVQAKIYEFDVEQVIKE